MGYLDCVRNIDRLINFQNSIEEEIEASGEFCPRCRCEMEVKESIDGNSFLECWNCGYEKEVDENG